MNSTWHSFWEGKQRRPQPSLGILRESNFQFGATAARKVDVGLEFIQSHYSL